MSKELIERLRSKAAKCGYGAYSDPLMSKAADRIEQLEAEVAAIKAEAAHWKSNHATEVRRARILKERTDMPIDRVAAYEKWKEDQNLLSGFYDLTGLMQSALEEDTARIGELREQLAASQAREQQFREALIGAHKALEAIGDEMTVGDRYTNAGQYLIDSLCPSREALALPSDTTALEALIAKAGEVMRERCWHSVPFGQIAICGAIRALPSITLEDLK